MKEFIIHFKQGSDINNDIYEYLYVYMKQMHHKLFIIKL